jgi:diguanylate cyclase (GGDEF)-like protein/PAS domain S-box-containing protein
MAATIPSNELDRLNSLLKYEVLDTFPEQAFDDIVRLASFICGTPISLISLVDKDRQWFKAKLGIELTETPRDISFCAYALDRPDELLVIPDAFEDSRFSSNALVVSDPNIRFYAGAPLVMPDRQVLGTLCVIDHIPRQLSDEQKKALGALARQVVAQFELKRKLIELEDSECRFKTFMNNSPAATFLKDDQGRMMYANQAYLERYNFNLNDVIGKNNFEIWPEKTAQELCSQESAILSGQETVSGNETIKITGYTPTYWQVHKFPVITKQRMLGGIAIDITEIKLYEQQLEEYQYELENTLDKLELLSSTDVLSGLKNRRAFDEKLKEEFDRAQRYHLSLSFLMIDVDRFKQFNDEYGHASGDALLKTIAEVLKKTARSHDTIARYGGEEFAIILPNTSREGALIIAERIRRAVATLPGPTRVTISAGISSLNLSLSEVTAMTDASALVSSADIALNKAKQNGRNRVCEIN